MYFVVIFRLTILNEIEKNVQITNSFLMKHNQVKFKLQLKSEKYLFLWKVGEIQVDSEWKKNKNSNFSPSTVLLLWETINENQQHPSKKQCFKPLFFINILSFYDSHTRSLKFMFHCSPSFAWCRIVSDFGRFFICFKF